MKQDEQQGGQEVNSGQLSKKPRYSTDGYIRRPTNLVGHSGREGQKINDIVIAKKPPEQPKITTQPQLPPSQTQIFSSKNMEPKPAYYPPSPPKPIAPAPTKTYVPPTSPFDSTIPVAGLPQNVLPKKVRPWRSIVASSLLIALAPVLAFSVTAFGFQSYQVDGQSMEKTLQNSDRLIISKLGRTFASVSGSNFIPSRGDIIVFSQNLGHGLNNDEKQLIKRVIGLPSERIVIKNGHIKVYNNENKDGFDPDKDSGFALNSSFTGGNVDVTLQDNEIFVCGDNRQNSEDSRYFGPVNAEKIIGKLVLRILPLDKAQGF